LPRESAVSRCWRIALGHQSQTPRSIFSTCVVPVWWRVGEKENSCTAGLLTTPFSTYWRYCAGLPSATWPKSSDSYAATFTIATAWNRATLRLHGPRRRCCNRVIYETSRLHCSLKRRPAFADVTLGSLRLLLSGPDQLSRVAHARWRSPGSWWLEPRHEARFGEGACRFRVARNSYPS
jgi:hypothetical protein